jgi:hypothetical protein
MSVGRLSISLLLKQYFMLMVFAVYGIFGKFEREYAKKNGAGFELSVRIPGSLNN